MPPPNSPRTIARWESRKTIATGTTAISVASASSGRKISTDWPPPVAGLNDGVDESGWERPTWIGYCVESASTTYGRKKLFQSATKTRSLATKLQAGDKLGVLAGVPGVPALDDRVKGMLKGLGPLKDEIEVVGNLRTDCAQDKGFAAAQTILTANPDLKAIYSACGPPAMGALQAIKRANLGPDDLITVGFDALPEEVAEIKKGNLDASVAQFPAKIGELGIDTLWKVVSGKKVSKNVDTGTALVTKANAGKFD